MTLESSRCEFSCTSALAENRKPSNFHFLICKVKEDIPGSYSCHVNWVLGMCRWRGSWEQLLSPYEMMVWFSRPCHSFVPRIRGAGGITRRRCWSEGRMILLWNKCLSLAWSPSQSLPVLSFFFLGPPFHSTFPLWCRPRMPPRVLLQKLPFSPYVSGFWKKRLHWVTIAGFLFLIRLSIFHLSFWTEVRRKRGRAMEEGD